MEQKLLVLIGRLNRIATKNRDEFQYRISIERFRDTLKFNFICEEKAEGHEFTSGFGSTIEESITKAEEGIPEALKQWGYKDAK